MPSTLDSALRNYLALAQREFQKRREKSDIQGRVRLLLDEEELLRRAVKSLEESQDFSELAKATAQDYHEDEFETRISGKWEMHAQAYFRLSGLYLSLSKGQAPPLSEVIEHYRAAFQAESHIVTHLAPLEFVGFSEDVIDCGGFQIRRFTREELDAILKNPVKKIFYERAYIDSKEIEDYWFLHVKEKVPAKEPGRTIVVLDARVTSSYSQYPQAVQAALTRLALYNWGSNPYGPPTKTLQAKYDAWDGPFRPHIPFVISCSDCLIEWPRRGPDLTELVKVPVFDPVTGEELGEEPSRGWWDERDLEAFVRHCGTLIARLQSYRGQWGFVETALGFFVKGFTAPPRPMELPGEGGLEQLLWYITAIEAVLGQKVDAGLTKLLLTRVSKVLGRTKEERKDYYRRFDTLYTFRSDLVHGNAGLASKEIYLGHLSEARDFSRGVVLWMLGYLNHVAEHLPAGSQAVPSREDLLAVLDMGADSRQHTAGVLQNLPTTFPIVEGWLAPGK